MSQADAVIAEADAGLTDSKPPVEAWANHIGMRFRKSLAETDGALARKATPWGSRGGKQCGPGS